MSCGRSLLVNDRIARRAASSPRFRSIRPPPLTTRSGHNVPPIAGPGEEGSFDSPLTELVERRLSPAQMFFDRPDDPHAAILRQVFQPGEHLSDLTG